MRDSVIMCGIEIPHGVLPAALACSVITNVVLFLVLRRAWKEDARWRR